MYDFYIFDLDGTLIDSIGDIAWCLNRMLESFSLPTVTEKQSAEMLGDGVRTLVRRALGPAHAEFLEEGVRRYRAHYVDHYVDRTQIYPGVVETLDALSGRKAIATNKPGPLSRKIMGALGIADRFGAILGEDDVGVPKPSPRIVETLIERLGPGRILFVGDTLVDAETARNAGVDACLVSYGYADQEALRAAGARYYIDSFSDLLRLSA